jgi:predicted dithiol-disulfide oxidoreductase (DUF899 family)
VQQQIVPRPQWAAARAELLAREKDATRAADKVRAARRALPMVAIEKEYALAGASGTVGLADLFEGRRQLIVWHFMWRFDTGEGCPTCSLVADNVGDLAHLHGCDTTLAFVSRAPLPAIERFRKRMGWPVPWYSSHGTDFNADFQATVDGGDRAGLSVFLRDGDRVLHTYSAYGRGAESLVGTYNWLDLTPLGRQRYVNEFPYHDRYDD